MVAAIRVAAAFRTKWAVKRQSSKTRVVEAFCMGGVRIAVQSESVARHPAPADCAGRAAGSSNAVRRKPALDLLPAARLALTRFAHRDMMRMRRIDDDCAFAALTIAAGLNAAASQASWNLNWGSFESSSTSSVSGSGFAMPSSASSCIGDSTSVPAHGSEWWTCNTCWYNDSARPSNGVALSILDHLTNSGYRTSYQYSRPLNGIRRSGPSCSGRPERNMSC